MRALIPRLLLAVTPLVAIAFLLTPPPAKTSSSLQVLYLDLVPSGPEGKIVQLVDGIPPNGTTWHELAPVYCTTYTQEGYVDNGNGIVDSCDVIKLNGINYHIEWAGPTYHTTYSADPAGPPLGTGIFDPTGPPSAGNPVCQIWHELYPNFCRQIHIDSFHDTDQNGALSVCDYVDVQTQDPSLPPLLYYHIDRIGLDITAVPVPDTPVEESTWGKIKSMFKQIF